MLSINISCIFLKKYNCNIRFYDIINTIIDPFVHRKQV
jgi:hypothetical protein